LNLFKLSYNYIKARPLNTVLNVLILALGISIIVILLLISKQVEEKLTKNASDIDLVVGAKGSPLQLILSCIYHIDYPTGNIPLADARKIANNRFVKKAIPLALGDSYEAYRIIGTSHSYPALYSQVVKEGRLWAANNEVTIGEKVAENLGLKVNDEFYGGHGIVAGGHSHEHPYKVVGIFKSNENILDNLILTNIESVWLMHDSDHAAKPTNKEEEHHEKSHERDTGANGNLLVSKSEPKSLKENGDLPDGESKEITALLVQYNSPMAIINMPRYVNSINTLQAASPSIETARLFSLIGVGITFLRGFAYLVIFIAALSIFIALYNSLKERKYDLAIMRSLGASRFLLFLHVILEGIINTVIGGFLGFLLGHLLIELIGVNYEKSNEAGITGWFFAKDEIYIGVMCLVIGLAAALIPAITVYRSDVSKVLAQG
jgi:putative ABC transport system permease protein